MFKETVNILENSKKNTPNITNALLTIQHYINEILKETRRMEEILKNIPHTTNAPKSDATHAPKNMTNRLNMPHTHFSNKTQAKTNQN